MKTYRDMKYLAIDNVLLLCPNVTIDEDLEVPEVLGKNNITCIGDGAFIGSWTVEKLTLHEKIERIGTSSFENLKQLTEIVMKNQPKSIGKDAFAKCPKLEKIVVNKCKISYDDYVVLKNNCIAGTNSRFVARTIPEFILPEGMLKALDYKGAEFIPDNIDFIYYQSEKGSLMDFIDEPKKMKRGIEFTQGFRRGTEITNFTANKERYNELTNYIGKTEENIDWNIRVNNDLSKQIKKVVVFVLEDKETQIQGDECTISYNLQIGYFYWQMAYKVMVDKKDYYIYVRAHLSDNPELKYVKQDIRVFRGNKIVDDIDEMQKVYSKYKLLSIL